MNDTTETKVLPSFRSGIANSPARATGYTRPFLGNNNPHFAGMELRSTTTNTNGMNINSEGKRIDAKYLWIEELDFEAYVEDTPLLPENKALLKRFLTDARLGKTIKKGAKKKIDRARLVKYVQDLRKLDAFFRKPLDTVTSEDMERFITALEDGKLLSMKGKPFGKETQVCIKKIVIKFYRWLNGGYVTPELVSWIDTSYKLKDYRAPKKEQVEAIINSISSNSPLELHRNRAIIMTLFDSGMRADELLNLRSADVWKEKGTYWVRIQFSKTKKRTLTLPHTTALLDQYTALRGILRPEEQFFPISYTALLKMIRRAGNTIGLKLSPHGLRHASATYWAHHLSRYQLCSRFGWAMSSKQPDRYIDQQGLEQEETTKIVEQSNLSTVQSENADLKRQLATLQEQMARFLEQDRRDLQNIIATVKAEIQQGK